MESLKIGDTFSHDDKIFQIKDMRIRWNFITKTWECVLSVKADHLPDDFEIKAADLPELKKS